MVSNQPKPQIFFPNAAFDVVALAASAGGLAALSEILQSLPANFPAAIVIVQHLDPHTSDMLSPILDRRTALRVKQAESGDKLYAETVYVAPPDQHLIINPNATLSLTNTKKLHFCRPSADRLFESLAQSCKNRAIAVVLTGMGRDGAMGIQAVKATGGVTIVQDRATAQFASMPNAAIQTQSVDLILPIEKIAATLIKLVTGEG